jgi:RND family efflux transporter MFP subunit
MILAFLVGGFGCHSKTNSHQQAALSLEPVVKVVKPTPRHMVRSIAQPGVIEAYEQTAVYPRVSGYVQKWYVDVGDRVKKDDLLAEIQVPDLVEEVHEKQALADQARAGAEQARKQVAVAERGLQAAADEIDEAKANVKLYQAVVERWESEVTRLTELSKAKVVDPQVLEETRKQLNASLASREAATRGVKTKQTLRLAAEAVLEKAKADVVAAEARVKVADASLAKSKAMLDYTRITAPYDAVITVRNINTGDIVRPATGESTDALGAEGMSATRATPLFVLHRTDKVMFVVGIPEMDAKYVTKGTPAVVRVQALGNEEFPATVSRTAWALSSRSRTLQAQIDIPNATNRFVPGMYAYGTVLVERDKTLAVPTAAIFDAGNQRYCFLVQDGKVCRTAVQTGISDGEWVELLRKQVKGPSGMVWGQITGDEKIAIGDPTELADGELVRVEEGP